MSAGAEKWWVLSQSMLALPIQSFSACTLHTTISMLPTLQHSCATVWNIQLLPFLLLLILYTRHLGGKEQLCRRRRRRGEASAFHFVVWKIEWKLNIRKLSIEIFRYGNEEYNI